MRRICFALVTQDFISAGMLASDLGIPFCCVVADKAYQGQHAVYKVPAERLEALVKNVQELNERL